MAFGLGSKYFALYELEGYGARWSNILQSPIADDSFNILIVIVMLLVDSLIYFIFAWYIEGVFPGIFPIIFPDYIKILYFLNNRQIVAS